MFDSQLKRLCPQIQDDGTIVVAGRPERWMQMTWNKQAFILLPKNHRFSILIAEQTHRETGHLGVAATVAVIRSRFWIIDIQRIVRSICYRCAICKLKSR